MSDSRVFSLPIVIRFDVLKDTGLGHVPPGVSFSVNEFNFQGMEKTLGDGIVIAGGSAPHAAAQRMTGEKELIGLRTILTATVGVNDRPRGEVAAGQSHGQCITDQLLCHPTVH